MYYVSVEELETVFCLWELHDIGEPASVYTQPVVDFPVSVSPPQSLSTKPLIVGSALGL